MKMDDLKKEHLKTDDLIIKSFICLFISLSNIDVQFIDAFIDYNYNVNKKTSIIGLDDYDVFLKFAHISDRFSHTLSFSNTKIKSFLEWFSKRINTQTKTQKKPPRPLFKVGVLGPSGGGKSTLCHYATYQKFKPPKQVDHKEMISIKTPKFDYKGFSFIPSLLDLRTEKIYFPNYPLFRKISGILMVFDTSNGTHLDQVELWLEVVEKIQPLPIILVGNKIDLAKSSGVTNEKIEELSTRYNILDYMECSAKSGQNVMEVFEKLYRKIVEKWF